MSQPNILLFVPDGVQGRAIDPDHICITPNMDRVSRNGVRIKGAYTPSPTCSPARASLIR
jgi:arylsulfatase A-like enzyme